MPIPIAEGLARRIVNVPSGPQLMAQSQTDLGRSAAGGSP